MQVTAAQLGEIVEHALQDAPDECCGVVALKDGVVERVVALENLAHSPFRFEIGAELVTTLNDIEDSGAELGVIYHSHTRSDPYPSQTDINFAAGWPGVEWLIVGTASAEPVVRSYLIAAGEVTEVEVEVT